MNLSGDEEKKRLTKERSGKTEDTLRRKGEPPLPSALASHYFSQVSVYMFYLIFLTQILDPFFLHDVIAL